MDLLSVCTCLFLKLEHWFRGIKMLRRKQNGLSLMDVVIAMLIIAILTVVAVPAYQTQIMQSHRSDAIQSLFAIQLAEEKYRVTNSSYGTLAQVWGGVSTTESGYYTLSITNVSATTYTITASAVGNQANDTADGSSCASLSLAYASGSTTKSPAACWAD